MDKAELKQAFELFSQASQELTGAYDKLERQVAHLSEELARANVRLREQVAEKETLSRRLEAILAALPGGVVVLDAGGSVEQANGTARHWLPRLAAGGRWEAVVESDLTATEVPGEWTTVASGQRIRLHESCLGAQEGHIFLLADLTEAHAMQQEMARQKRLTAMGEMAAALAHQLRTPLATALLNVAHLAGSRIAEADRQRLAEKALVKLRHLEQLVADMLRFVRGERTPVQRVAVADLLADLQLLVEPAAAERQVHLEIAPCPALSVQADREALLGALTGLVDNALRASPAGASIRISGRAENGRIRLTVADEGEGMTPEVLGRLFEPFYTTRHDGTGLGLAIVRQVAEAHAGTVEVTSAPGRGATFAVVLPELPKEI